MNAWTEFLAEQSGFVLASCLFMGGFVYCFKLWLDFKRSERAGPQYATKKDLVELEERVVTALERNTDALKEFGPLIRELVAEMRTIAMDLAKAGLLSPRTK